MHTVRQTSAQPVLVIGATGKTVSRRRYVLCSAHVHLTD